MLVKRQKSETVNIPLPYYSKDGIIKFRIGKDETILKVVVGSEHTYATMCVVKKGDSMYESYLRDAVNADSCDPAEVEYSLMQAIEAMDTILNGVNA